MSGRTIVIGDVHGCRYELDLMLDSLQPGARDTVVFLGDLVNKGPDSVGVLRRARELDARCLLGNHEARLRRYRATGDETLLKAGDRATLTSLNQADWAQIEAMERTIALPEFQALAVHGGFLPEPHWSEQSEEVVTQLQVIDESGRARKRSDAPQGRPWADYWPGPEFVVYGHTPRPEVLRRPHSIGIDTGCVYGGSLTAMVFPHRILCQVKARRAYAS